MFTITYTEGLYLYKMSDININDILSYLKRFYDKEIVINRLTLNGKDINCDDVLSNLKFY